jgi:hypothetical protein
MDVQDFKRWHWIAIGVVVGLVLSYVWSQVEPTIPRSIGALTFEQGLAAPAAEGNPILNKIVVHPPQEGVFIATGEQLTPTDDPHRPVYKPFSFKAETPYVPIDLKTNARVPGSSNETILTYLQKAQKQNPNIKFRYAWWHEKWATYAIWTTASVVVIGGIWPTIINILVGAGLAKKKEPKETYDLDRFKSAPEPEAKAEAKKEPSESDLDQMKKLEEELERRIASGEPMPVGAAAPGQTSEQPVKKLTGQVEAPVLVEKPKDDKEFAGEFYPVDRGGKKKV